MKSDEKRSLIILAEKCEIEILNPSLIKFAASNKNNKMAKTVKKNV